MSNSKWTPDIAPRPEPEPAEFYPQDSETVITFWHALESERAMQETRELGFHSVADGLTKGGMPKRGHYPVDYLRDALGLPRSD